MRVDGAVIATSTIAVAEGTFPVELEFVDVTQRARLAVTIEGYLGSTLRVVRTMETEAGPPGERRLVRVHLEQRCDRADDGDGVVAPTCDEVSETCISGTCASALVAVGQQKPYSPDWATAGTGDGCKPGGAPEVIVGKGQSDFFAAEDNEVAQVEAGPQGGHHIWIAARVKNLRRSGSITEVGGEIPALGLSITPLKVIFTLDSDEGGYCKIYGLRFQLDAGGDDIEAMLGQPVTVYVKIVDPDGAQGTDEHTFTVSSDIL